MFAMVLVQCIKVMDCCHMTMQVHVLESRSMGSSTAASI